MKLKYNGYKYVKIGNEDSLFNAWKMLTEKVVELRMRQRLDSTIQTGYNDLSDIKK